MAQLLFIGAIKVISMLDGMIPPVASPVPLGTGFKISADVAFGTVYGINVSGLSLSPRNDSLWRVWETDWQFLINSASTHAVSTNPASIRSPAGCQIWSMQLCKKWWMVDNQKFNISWLFKVGLHFSYLARLDFLSLNLQALPRFPALLVFY